ncbi:MAG: hypothetical protein ACJA1Q_002735 [Pseudohongiellaceae bacterium]|jgi:hypothetical protein
MIMDLLIEFRKMCWNLMVLLRVAGGSIIAAADSDLLL